MEIQEDKAIMKNISISQNYSGFENNIYLVNTD